MAAARTDTDQDDVHKAVQHHNLEDAATRAACTSHDVGMSSTEPTHELRADSAPRDACPHCSAAFGPDQMQLRGMRHVSEADVKDDYHVDIVEDSAREGSVTEAEDVPSSSGY